MPTTEGPTPRIRLLTVPQAAQWLSCSQRQVWQMLASRKLTPIRLGSRSTRIDAAEVERMIEAARAASAK